MNKLIPIYKIIHALLFGSIYFVLECIWKCTFPFSAVAGQINLFFGLAWMFLSGICIVLDDSLHYYVWKHDGKVDRPFYRIGEKRWYLPEKK